MEEIKTLQVQKNLDQKLNLAFALSIFTIIYNLLEGTFSAWFGYADSTLALFGFGVDSFVEVLSGLGIAHMIWRMKRSQVEEADRFERQALWVTGSGFYILTAGLTIGAIYNIIENVHPTTTIAGIIISGISILTMYILYKAKLNVGHALDSDPIISDANCTLTCFYLSLILMGSSLLYELWQVPYIDAIGSLGIAWFAWSEGREAFEKAEKRSLTCTCHD